MALASFKHAKHEETGNKSDLNKDIYMNFMGIPSLKNIAIVNLVGKILKEPVLASGDTINDFFSNSESFDWDTKSEFHKVMEEKIIALQMPDNLDKEVFNAVVHISLEIEKFFSWDCDFYQPISRLFQFAEGIEQLLNNSSYLNVHGFLDEQKIIESLLSRNVSNSTLIEELFFVASVYCHQDLITKIWNMLDESAKNELKTRDWSKNLLSRVFAAYWTCKFTEDSEKFLDLVVRGNLSETFNVGDPMSKNMLRLAIKQGVPTAVEFFWSQLTLEDEREGCIAHFIEIAQTCAEDGDSSYDFDSTITTNMNRIRVLLFLISQVRTDQLGVLRSNPGIVLNALLQCWHLHHHIVPTFELVLHKLDLESYEEFVDEIICKISQTRNMHFNYIFRGIWSASTPKFKKHFVKNLGRNSCVLVFLCTDDLDSIHLILEGVSLEKKLKIFKKAFSNDGISFIVQEDKLQLFEHVLKIFFDSESIVRKFKQKASSECEELLCRWCDKENISIKWQYVENFINWIPDIEALKESLDIEIIASSASTRDNFEYLYHFLKWFGISSADPSITEHIHLESIILSIIKGDLYNQFDEVMDILYDSKEHKRRNIRKAIVISLRDLMNHWSFRDRGNFAKLVSWCCYSSEELDEFKKTVADEISEFTISGIYAIIELLFDYSEFFQSLLAWCFGSENEVLRFKNDLLFSTFAIKLVELQPEDYILRTDFFDPLFNESTISKFTNVVEDHLSSYPNCSCKFHDASAVQSAIEMFEKKLKVKTYSGHKLVEYSSDSDSNEC